MNDVSLREFIETIVREHDRRQDALRAEDRQRFEDYKVTIAKALQLQALDYKEHFERLNGEAGRIQSAISVTVSRDTWNGFQKEFLELKDRVTMELADRTGKSKALPYILSIISVLISVLAVVVVVVAKH